MVRFDYPLLHPGVLRGVMARIGEQAGVDALYWRSGLAVYEAQTDCRAMIEQAVLPQGWAGTVTVQTKGRQATVLSDLLTGWIAEENHRLGLKANMSSSSAKATARRPGRVRRTVEGDTEPQALRARAARRWRQPMDVATRDENATPMQPRFVAAPARQYAISYAWNDATGGPEREDVVNQLEAAARQRGRTVLRDKSAMGPGDRISVFTQEIARSERIFVFLSKKYLRSYYCMAELYEIWRRCEDEAAFRHRVRVYKLPDVNISEFEARIECQKWWRARHESMKQAVEGADDISTADQDELRRTGHIARHAPEILALIRDTISVRNIDDLIRLEFPIASATA